MNRRELLGMALSAGVLSKTLRLTAQENGLLQQENGLLQLDLRSRDSLGVSRTTTEHVDPRRVAILAIDIWDYNVCKTWRTRAESLIPRINYCFDAARKLGMTLVFSPTNSMRDLNESLQRKATLALPNHAMPAGLALPDPYPGALKYAMCECGEGELCFYTNNTNNQHPDLKMVKGDFIALFQQEAYNIFRERRITHIIYTGFASNMCLWGKPTGMKYMRQLGFQCLFARDLTEAETGYIPQSFNPTRGTNQVNELIERDLAPSIDMEQTVHRAGVWDGEPILDFVHISPWGRLFGGPAFPHPIEVELTCRHRPSAKIRYTLDGSDPTAASPVYERAIAVNKNAVLRAAAFEGQKVVTRINEASYWKYPPVPNPPDVFLSDLQLVREEAGEVKPNSYAIKRAARFDRSVVGNVLTNHDRKFRKGIGGQAPSELTFPLKPEYKHFVALAGVDDECTQWDDPDGLKQHPWQWSRPIHGPTSYRICKIAFDVEIDRKRVAETPPLFNGEKAWGVDVPIPEGAREVTLRIKDVESRTADPHGHGDWLDAGFLLG
jgi:nicotinamidase-related amidase